MNDVNKVTCSGAQCWHGVDATILMKNVYKTLNKQSDLNDASDIDKILFKVLDIPQNLCFNVQSFIKLTNTTPS